MRVHVHVRMHARMLVVFIEDSSSSVTGSLKDARLAGPRSPPLTELVQGLGSASDPFHLDPLLVHISELRLAQFPSK